MSSVVQQILGTNKQEPLVVAAAAKIQAAALAATNCSYKYY
jgi:hypothetical protein